MSLSRPLLLLGWKLGNARLGLPSFEWDFLDALLLCHFSSPEVPNQFTFLFPPFRVFLWLPLGVIFRVYSCVLQG